MLHRKSVFVSALLKEFMCDIFEHAMYIKDLAPSDYHLFRYIKLFLAGQRMRCDQDTKHVLQDWLKGLQQNSLHFRRRYTNVGPKIRRVL